MISSAHGSSTNIRSEIYRRDIRNIPGSYESKMDDRRKANKKAVALSGIARDESSTILEKG